MRSDLKGKLVKWNAKKGFGFIRPNNGSKNIFIHISDFKEKGFTPYVGETIFYSIGRGKDGKEKAISAYSNRKKLTHVGIYDKQKQQSYRGRNILNRRFILILFLGLFIMIGGLFKNFSTGQNSTQPLESHGEKVYQDSDEDIDEFLKKTDEFIVKLDTWEKNHITKSTDNSSKKLIRATTYSYKKDVKRNLHEIEKYHCDRRKYCGQMNSCEEAKYFLKHCPNTKMDGDGDGIPCESQWCGH